MYSKPVGVTFHFRNPPNTGYAAPHEPVRFCQAVKMVKDTSTGLRLTKDTLSCTAAKYVFGFENTETLNECLENLVAAKRFKDREVAKKALMDVPRITGAPSSVTLSVNDFSPDVFILYLKPVQFMQVVQAYQERYIHPIDLTVPSVVPVCGGCAVAPYLTQRITVSFGCDDSREHGGINGNQLVMGIPYCIAGLLAKSLEILKGDRRIDHSVY
ncbi:MAG: DUF169 domain-containing protein [Candidatus Bathyarchaeota archaeon]|nr:DUF169 domain-containing protein [Candidatus Bathyarchaeota archaeon]